MDDDAPPSRCCLTNTLHHLATRRVTGNNANGREFALMLLLRISILVPAEVRYASQAAATGTCGHLDVIKTPVL
jgi:hypothetical protein